MKSSCEKEVEKLLLENYQRYYRLAYSYTKHEQDALDVLQESAYKAIKNCEKVHNQEYLATWIYRIVINTALDYLRKKKKEEPIAEQREIPVWEEKRDWELSDLLNHLPQKERTLIILRYFEDMKLEDIAKVTGENINTVKARLYRTLKKMRVLIEKEEKKGVQPG